MHGDIRIRLLSMQYCKGNTFPNSMSSRSTIILVPRNLQFLNTSVQFRPIALFIYFGGSTNNPPNEPTCDTSNYTSTEAHTKSLLHPFEISNRNTRPSSQTQISLQLYPILIYLPELLYYRAGFSISSWGVRSQSSHPKACRPLIGR